MIKIVLQRCGGVPHSVPSHMCRIWTGNEFSGTKISIEFKHMVMVWLAAKDASGRKSLNTSVCQGFQSGTVSCDAY